MVTLVFHVPVLVSLMLLLHFRSAFDGMQGKACEPSGRTFILDVVLDTSIMF